MRNWKTTLSGIASIIAGITLYVNDPLKINEAIGLIVVGVGFFVAKDGDVSGTGK